jgi:hypothetical protein
MSDDDAETARRALSHAPHAIAAVDRLEARADKAEALLRAVAFDDRHKLQPWLEPLYVRDPYVRALVDRATELLGL